MSENNPDTSAKAGTLYVVATPIGNLDDLGTRARAILAGVELVLAEDTRHSKKLLAHYGINTSMQALHEHNERAMLKRVLQKLRHGKSVAMISDAGTPLINDPGYILVRGAHDAGIAVRAVPGPSALTAALSIAAMPVDRFSFEGFLPPRQASRQHTMEELSTETRTMVFFEVPHRMRQFATDAEKVFGSDRETAVVKEISKIHETVWRGRLGDLEEWLSSNEPVRGEFVVILAGAAPGAGNMAEALRIMRIVSAKLPPREAAAVAAKITGHSSSKLYDLAKNNKQK